MLAAGGKEGEHARSGEEAVEEEDGDGVDDGGDEATGSGWHGAPAMWLQAAATFEPDPDWIRGEGEWGREWGSGKGTGSGGL